MTDPLQRRLQALFRSAQPVVAVRSSTSGFMEAAIRNGVDERVLVVVGGERGERFAAVAEACDKLVVRARVHPGRTLEPEHLARFLEGPEVDAVALVHVELSTGALAPLEALAAVVRARRNVLLLVDASGSLGGSPVEADRWGLDFTFSPSHLALGLPAGLALGVSSERLLERAKGLPDRGYYFDLLRVPSDSDPLTTDRTLRAGVEAGLTAIEKAGGIEACWRRHEGLRVQVERWVALHPGVSLLALEGRRAWTRSVLRLDGGLAEQVVGGLGAVGWAQAGAGGTLRLDHMGWLTPAELEARLSQLDRALEEKGLRT